MKNKFVTNFKPLFLNHSDHFGCDRGGVIDITKNSIQKGNVLHQTFNIKGNKNRTYELEACHGSLKSLWHIREYSLFLNINEPLTWFTNI